MYKTEEEEEERQRKMQAAIEQLDEITRLGWGNPPLKDGKPEAIKFKWLLIPTIY